MMADKSERISVFLSYIPGIVWSIALVVCLAGDLRISIIALAGALLLTGAILLVIKRIGGRIYYSRVFVLVVIFGVLGVPVVPGFRDASLRRKTSTALSQVLVGMAARIFESKISATPKRGTATCLSS